MLERLTSENWGLVEYGEAVERQLAAVDEVAGFRSVNESVIVTQCNSNVGGESVESDTGLASSRISSENLSGERLVFCSHPPLVTIGRGTKPGDVFGWKGAILETARGGRATYHGPSQIVVYPILNLNVARVGFKARDIHGYMHAIERAIVETLREFGIRARAGSELTVHVNSEDATHASSEPSLTGVWAGDKKIASVGIGVRKGISYHGLALNVENDPQAFQGINPCGFTTEKMTSVKKELGEPVDRSAIQKVLEKELRKQFVATK